MTYYWAICDSSSPGMDGRVYRLPYAEAVEGKRHGYEVPGRTRLTSREWAHGVEWTRNPNHPPDPRCPECHGAQVPPGYARPMQEPRERLVARYRRIMELHRHVDQIGNARSNRGDWAGASRAWTRADAILQVAQKMSVPGKNGQ